MKQLKENLERILKVRDTDLGLFILAMHSLIERTLKEKYGIKSYDSENTFGKLIDRYTTEFYETHGSPVFPGSEKRNFSKREWNLLQGLNKIIKNHELANDVRHRFETKSEEDAQATVKCFLSFAEAENWTNLDALNKLKRELDNWDSHSPYQSAELTKAIAQIKLLKSQNENLAEKVNNLEDRPIRFLVDDVRKFVKREIRRGNKYDIIIMDPPSFGRGSKNEVWSIESDLAELIKDTVELLSDETLLFIINSYTTGLAPSVLGYMMDTLITQKYGGHTECQELGLPVTNSGLALPCGSTGRWFRD
jgi:hypothetical protein